MVDSQPSDEDDVDPHGAIRIGTETPEPVRLKPPNFNELWTGSFPLPPVSCRSSSGAAGSVPLLLQTSRGASFPAGTDRPTTT